MKGNISNNSNIKKSFWNKKIITILSVSLVIIISLLITFLMSFIPAKKDLVVISYDNKVEINFGKARYKSGGPINKDPGNLKYDGYSYVFATNNALRAFYNKEIKNNEYRSNMFEFNSYYDYYDIVFFIKDNHGFFSLIEDDKTIDIFSAGPIVKYSIFLPLFISDYGEYMLTVSDNLISEENSEYRIDWEQINYGLDFNKEKLFTDNYLIKDYDSLKYHTSYLSSNLVNYDDENKIITVTSQPRYNDYFFLNEDRNHKGCFTEDEFEYIFDCNDSEHLYLKINKTEKNTYCK